MNKTMTGGMLILLAAVTFAAWTAQPNDVQAHCQVPCGIFDDPARIAQLREDTTTIAKAIDQINAMPDNFSANDANQAIRWVITKEEHASDIIEVVGDYYLAQRVKPVAPGAEGYEAYLKKLADHHAVMIAAMKTKQSADPATVKVLTAAIDKMAVHYPKKAAGHNHHHDHEHAAHDHHDHNHSHDAVTSLKTK